MLKSLNEIMKFSVEATDGEMGSVYDFLFSDKNWAIRYLVVDTGNWLPGRKVLVPVTALGEVDWTDQTFSVDETREEIKEGPDIDTDKPVSRQEEEMLHGFYGWFPYWQTGIQPASTGIMTRIPEPAQAEQEARKKGDPHLRSTREVDGYHINATDGEIGHVEDFLADEEQWIIRFLVVDTRNWLPSKKVLISPQWATEVDWHDQQLHMDKSRQEIREAPEYDPLLALEREKEEEILRYYGMPKYWL
ncbi:MAG: PRC-barrel domain-containing protein [Candidatus Sumerlaeota bacterium]